jgi:peptide/nickel transport system ATP-binding protein
MTELNDIGRPVLQVENLAVSYLTRAGDVPAVSDISLTLRANESFGLVGESGCGKSTVAMAIMRYLGANGSIVRGRVNFEGRDMASLSPEELRRIRGSRLAMVYQEPMSALNPSLRVGYQLMEVPRIHGGASKAEAYELALTMLGNVRMADPVTIMDRYPHQLSGGQQQRVVIAMALLTNPALLILDEPTTALDVTVAAAVVDLIAELRHKFSTALLYISHNLGLITKVCDRVGVMYAGELVEEGFVRDVFRRPRHPYTAALLGCIPSAHARMTSRDLKSIRGQVSSPRNRPKGCGFGPRCDHLVAGRCDAGPIAIEPLSVGAGAKGNDAHLVRCVRWQEIGGPLAASAAGQPDPDRREAPEVLRVSELTKFYSLSGSPLASRFTTREPAVVKANEGVSFTAEKGRIVGIVGESGCGKSTFAKLLTGLEIATSGRIEFAGHDLAAFPVARRGRDLIRALQIVFQDPDGTLNPHHSVGYALGRAIRKLGVADARTSAKEKIGDLLELVGLPRDYASRRPHRLSGGQKQRVSIARALAGNPTLIVADEPVSALDVSVQASIVNLLLDLQKKYDTSLLFISHDLSLIAYLADHVVVMYLGQIMESGPTEAILRPPYHPYTEALLSAVPIADPDIRQKRVRLEGELPSAIDPPKGCRFATRCPHKLGTICDTDEPPDIAAGPDHRIKCHIPIPELARHAPVFRERASA